MALIAGVLTVVIVAILVYVGQANRGHLAPTPATTPSPSAASSPTAAGLTPFAGPCRLAVVWPDPTPPNEAAGGGFIAFPGATFAADPQAHTAQNGEYWFTYNSARGSWLPVLRQFASPDGTKYLFFTLANGTLMHVTDATTGQGYDLENDSINWWPVGMDNAGAYAADQNRTGLWRLPFNVSKPVQVVADGWWVAVNGGYAWGFPAQSLPAGATSQLQRLDLTTGVRSTFANVAGQIIGFDGSGLPILWSAGDQSITALSASGDPTVIATGFALAKAPNFSYMPYTAVGDVNGIWLAGSDGIYLYAQGRMGKVSTVVAIPASGCA